MRKFKLMFDKDKEIEWLNAMCQNGWALKRFKYGLYTFEPCVPGEYVFDTDLNDNVLTLSSGYRELLKEMHIEFLCCSGFWFLVRRKASYGPLELYTDYESKIGQYRKIRNMFKAVAILELLVMYMQLYAYWMDRDWIFLAAAVVLFLMFFTLLRGAFDERAGGAAESRFARRDVAQNKKRPLPACDRARHAHHIGRRSGHFPVSIQRAAVGRRFRNRAGRAVRAASNKK